MGVSRLAIAPGTLNAFVFLVVVEAIEKEKRQIWENQQLHSLEKGNVRDLSVLCVSPVRLPLLVSVFPMSVFPRGKVSVRQHLSLKKISGTVFPV